MNEQTYITEKPTLADIEMYIYTKGSGLIVTAKEIFDYWEAKDWKTKKGELPKTLDSLVNVVNSVKSQRLRQSQMVKAQNTFDLRPISGPTIDYLSLVGE